MAIVQNLFVDLLNSKEILLYFSSFCECRRIGTKMFEYISRAQQTNGESRARLDSNGQEILGTLDASRKGIQVPRD